MENNASNNPSRTDSSLPNSSYHPSPNTSLEDRQNGYYQQNNTYPDNIPAAGNGSPNPSNQPSSDALLLHRLTNEVDSLKHVMTAQSHEASTEINRLRSQVRWLTGISAVAIVVLGGSLIGISLGLRQEQVALRENQEAIATQLETLQSEQVDPEQIGQLESLLDSLNQATDDLQGQAERIAEQLPDVSLDQVQSIQRELQDLQQNIQDNLSEGGGGVMDRVNSLYQRLQRFISGGEGNDTPQNDASGDAAGEPEGANP